MPQPHFSERYQRYVRDLIADRPLDEAMAQAVGAGGDYLTTGNTEADLLVHAGLKPNHSLIDIGCGSGRLSTALSRRFGDALSYLGIDISPELLDYARTRAAASYRFELHDGLTIPAPDGSADFIVAFSVFTHLLHEETYIYLRDARRALKPGGTIVFSFLELPHHWSVFDAMAESPGKTFTIFIERSMIEEWAKRLDLQISAFNPYPFGQSVVVLRHR